MREPKPPRRHHTVPKLLLKRFVNERKMVPTWLVRERRLAQLNPADASVRGDFNAKENGSFELEMFYANEIEGPFASVLDRLLAAPPGVIFGAEKKLVCSFFIAQFLRVQAARDAFNRRAREFMRENAPRQSEELQKIAGKYGTNFGPSERRAFEADLIARAEKQDNHIDLVRGMIPKHASKLETRVWITVDVPFGRELVLSDAPAKSVKTDLETGQTQVMDTAGLARPM